MWYEMQFNMCVVSLVCCITMSVMVTDDNHWVRNMRVLVLDSIPFLGTLAWQFSGNQEI